MKIYQKIVVWGSGIRGKGFIDYIGCENVIVIVDNGLSREHSEYCSVPIVGFDTYLEKYRDYFIVITPMIYEDIVEQLKENQVFQYFVLAENPSEIQGYGIADIFEHLPVRYDVGACNVIYGAELFGTLLYDFLRNKGCERVFIMLHNDMDFQRREAYRKCYHMFNIIDNIEQLGNKYGKIFVTVSDYNIESLDKKNWTEENAFDFSDRISAYKNIVLEKFKNVEKGKRGFIVCTGPSLRMEDLNMLDIHDEVCISMNKISYAFSYTQWRPKYYICWDRKMLREFNEQIKMMDVQNKFLPDVENHFWNNSDEIYQFHCHVCMPGTSDIQFSEDISKKIYCGYTVTYAALQLSYYLGLEDVYIIGADFDYTMDTNEACNHFVKEYVAPNGQTNLFSRKGCIVAYKRAREFAEEHGMRIWNATRGGKLEVFERADFDKLF
ncbi:6-hydroxymethylpterin diphosphokinase MptE-like protein [Enterocloster bolteae]|uniref:6-hydroxymethylpterin diphosphokinase MptE-like protein n=1 Tax=Enterocloster bolteae TaxID=208479 RepID=UPI002904E257|nr:6-hydroxymethylpterin diphosphokinase MptE-like protein [Enterocloster bolteae]MDU1138081.1 6-hydroxymethylpterin diphosphokinase MptE-like protein [Enterocloster bolteae]